MSDHDPDDLAESLRKWLDEGNLNDSKSVPQTIDIAQMKRKAAQRILAAQRAQSAGAWQNDAEQEPDI